jgi:hypothetical protein
LWSLAGPLETGLYHKIMVPVHTLGIPLQTWTIAGLQIQYRLIFKPARKIFKKNIKARGGGSENYCRSTNNKASPSGFTTDWKPSLFEKELLMKNLRILTILALVALCATSAFAFDLATTAAVEIVEGVTVSQTTGMDFGSVANKTGTLVLSTNPATVLTDASFISVDPATKSPAVFTVDSINGADVSFAFTPVAGTGLSLDTWTISVDGGTTELAEAAHGGITLASASTSWNVGASLDVVGGTAVNGSQTVSYTIGVTLD